LLHHARLLFRAHHFIVTTAFLLLTSTFLAAQDKSGKKEKQGNIHETVEKVKGVLQGFEIGPKTRFLPYASLENWFDPYGGFKLGHVAPWHSSDKLFHHVRVESVRDFSWKLRYVAASISSSTTQFSFLFKTKFDRDSFFYGLGNRSVKTKRQPATYSSVFFGTEISQVILNKTVYRWSTGIWHFKSGLLAGGEFEKPASAQYFTTRFTLSDIKSIDYWNSNTDRQWDTYLEIGLTPDRDTSPYAKFHFQTITRFPVTGATKFGIGTKFEYLFAANRHEMPYFAIPELGSRNGLRGFSNERFRDYGVIGLNFEYSLHLSRDMETFALSDVARTASKLENFSVGHLHSDFGLGFRYKNNNKPISMGMAKGDEGWKLFTTMATGLPW